MKRRLISSLTLLIALLALMVWIGCAAEEAADEPAAEPTEPAASTAGGGAPRAFFTEPADGATVGTLVKLKFGIENFEIEPVGDGMVHAGKGHYHVGLDTTCLPPGIVIPTADPWVHFGDGSSEIDFSLAPGEHTLTLQIGDGEHRTLDEPGLCTTITVTAAEDAQ